MTREEAIEWLTDIKNVTENWSHDVAIDMAIEALSDDTVQGEWKHTITGQPYCSNCEYVFGEDEEFSSFWKYCPMCGSRMKGAEHEID